jgi:hypothetical protein
MAASADSDTDNVKVTDNGLSNQQPSDVELGQEKAAPAPPPLFTPAPDGGADAWLCVGGAACILFCSLGYVNSYGVFQQVSQVIGFIFPPPFPPVTLKSQTGNSAHQTQVLYDTPTSGQVI